MDSIPIQNSNVHNASSSVLNPKGNDNTMFLVSNLLTGNENYMQWKFSIKLALGAKKKTGFVDGTSKQPESVGTDKMNG